MAMRYSLSSTASIPLKLDQEASLVQFKGPFASALRLTNHLVLKQGDFSCDGPKNSPPLTFHVQSGAYKERYNPARPHPLSSIECKHSMEMRRSFATLNIGVTALLFLLLFSHGHAIQFVFNGFNPTSAVSRDLVLEQAASFVQFRGPFSPVLRLTNHSDVIIGRALYSHSIPMKTDDVGAAVSFSTTFVFSIVPPTNTVPGQGMAFFFTPSQLVENAVSAQYLGLFNFTNDNSPSSHLLAVEFDTVFNIEFQDPDNNHVGLDINSLVSKPVHSAGYYEGRGFTPVKLSSGQNYQVWIDYNASGGHLTVTLVPAGKPRPRKPLLSVSRLNLSQVFEENMYVGFSASTGQDKYVEDHYILAWSFSTEGPAPDLNLSLLPSLVHLYNSKHRHGQKQIIVGSSVAVSAVVFVLMGLFVYIIFRSREEEIEEWEKEFWPHRFTYKDLNSATRGFKEENFLGSGGCGKVYRGTLLRSGQEIAVKCITKEITEGMKDFIAEISSMGRLQHRSLVHLRGWCRRKQKLFIVYDYMPNGSLDRWIFGTQESVLTWEKRYSILREVAAALMYLHEGWEKCVVHRDIKASNVLLDSELNGRLGDFGQAKLYEHNENPRTTQVVGTLGYIAPELIHTGKATPASDVFALGCLLLEVACGRRPVEPTMDKQQMVLVDWVALLARQGRLLDSADPTLGSWYKREEMETVLQLGLMCCHPQAEARPSTRHVVDVLEKEV